MFFLLSQCLALLVFSYLVLCQKADASFPKIEVDHKIIFDFLYLGFSGSSPGAGFFWSMVNSRPPRADARAVADICDYP